MTKYGMAIDTARCTGCQTCAVACQMHNALRPGVAWLHVDTVSWGRWPDGGYLFLPHACLHCEEPPCVDVCPTGASRQGEDGIVSIDGGTCIGCSVCVAACPYGARTINRDESWFFGAAEPAPYEDASNSRVGIAEKCTFCAPRLAQGLEPACVAACPNGARAFGDLDDAGSEVNRLIAKTGAARAGKTAVWYARPAYAQHVDPEREIARLRRLDTDRDAHGGAAAGTGSGEANPAVLATASVAGAAAAGGIALAARRARKQQAKPVPDAPQRADGAPDGRTQPGAHLATPSEAFDRAAAPDDHPER